MNEFKYKKIVLVAILLSTTSGCTSYIKSDKNIGSSPLKWESCDQKKYDGWGDRKDSNKYQCALLETDEFYGTGENVKLALAKRNATGKKIGSLLYVAGGPGDSELGYSFNEKNKSVQRLYSNFDIISYAPRGIKPSTPNIAVDSESNDYLGSMLKYNTEGELKVTTTNGYVRDVEYIRKALGEDKITAYGISYGTKVLSSYAENYPDKIRALALQGIVDLNDDLTNIEKKMYSVKNDIFEELISYCKEHKSDICIFKSADVKENINTFKDLANSLNDTDNPKTDKSGNTIDRDKLVGHILERLTFPHSWDDIIQNLHHINSIGIYTSKPKYSRPNSLYVFISSKE